MSWNWCCSNWEPLHGLCSFHPELCVTRKLINCSAWEDMVLGLTRVRRGGLQVGRWQSGTSWLPACCTLNPSELMISGSCREQLRAFAWLHVWAQQPSCSAAESQSAERWGHCMRPVQLRRFLCSTEVYVHSEKELSFTESHTGSLPCPAEGWQWRHRKLCVATGNICWLGGLFVLIMLYFFQTQLDVKVSVYEFVQFHTLATPPGKQCRGIISFK